MIFIIPVYQHGDLLADTLQGLMQFDLPIIVVNDGSDASHTKHIIEACKAPHITLLHRDMNGGKGAAVIAGVTEASRLGYRHAFQLDADGQHDLSQIPTFIQTSKLYSNSIVLGHPIYDESVPLSRKLGRLFTHLWIWINTLSLDIKDSMCGFRIYPIKPIMQIMHTPSIGKYMDFDPELCVRAKWADIAIVNLPIGVIYPATGRSNFRMKEDNILISKMHTRLFFGMLIRLPILVWHKVRAVTFTHNQ